MDDNILTFLLELARDPKKLADFQADPEAALERAGLPEAERAAILSKDSDRIREAVTAAMTPSTGGAGAGLAPAKILDPVMIVVVIRF